MAPSGVRAQRFLQPAPGGASAVFARQRGMVAPAPARLQAAEEKESRSGKASGRDYGNFFSRKRNVSAIQGAVNALKGLLVGTFIAAKSLGATLKNVVGQINGFVGNKGGGLLGKLGTIGLVAAVVVGVAAIFGPQIKKAFDFLKTKAEEIFQNVKQALASVDEKIKSFYNTIKDFYTTVIIGTVNNINSIIDLIREGGNKLFHLPTNIGGFDVSVLTNPIKDVGKKIYGIPSIKSPPEMPSYEQLFNGGINFLSGYDSLGDLGSSMMSGLGGMLGGGIDSMTGFVGDLINNLLASLGLTDAGNQASEFLGMGSLFGESRELGSGPGISSLLPGGFGGIIPGIKSTLGLSESGSSPDYGQGRTNASGASGGSQTQMEVAQTLVTEFKNQGLSSEGAKLATAEIGRENSLNAKTILGTHDDGGVKAYGAISWQGGREKVLFDELRARGIDPSEAGLAGSGDEGIRANAAAMVKEMQSRGHTELLGLLRKQNLSGGEKDRVRQLMKDRYFVYNQSIPIQRSRDWYDRVDSFGLQSMVQPAPAQTQSSNTTVPKPVSRASTIVMPVGTQVAQAPRRPRPDISVPNVSGAGGNPTIPFYSPSFPDPFGLNPIGAYA